ncbi:His Kinase A (phospho-acceptor) domain-containing protein [Tenacibaculum sp. MAR_2009_124]|uniref:hybrid sensor histidine kinase/response regulator transcription factor n=1 Tax=Tenacibaculum sp. MAR_2009_124 TaxID=1250059 RepID=UPI00089918B0|nr:response regulator [Tenacibaculum sp. MAR_2009_124]SEB35453.1 His Kinase A (phospho-acceptor) domain-containing protein [Tenacibaculum sp. MAR_2009_124]
MILAAQIVLLLGACTFEKKKTSEYEITIMTLKEFDSIRDNLSYAKLDPDQISETIRRLTKEVQFSKNSNETAKRNRLLAIYYLIFADYQKANERFDTVGKYYKKHAKWKQYVCISKLRAISYRGQGRYSKMEEVLKEAIEISKEQDVIPYDLLPIHELSVYYSYDIGNPMKGIEYGKIFIDKLKKYDTIKEERRAYDSIKGHNLNILLLNLTRSYIETRQLDKADENLKFLENEFTKVGDVEKIMRVYSNYIDYYVKKSDTNKIQEYKEKYFKYSHKFNDSLITINRRISEANLQLMKKEKSNLMEDGESNRKVLVIAFLGTLLLLIFLFERYFLKLKYEKEGVELALENEQDFKKFRASLFINIAHEIRTPLSLILGYIDLSTDKTINREELKKYLKEIRRKSNKVIDNVSEVISLIKEDKPKEEVKLEKVIIEPHLQQLFFSFEGIAKIKQVKLEYNVKLPENYFLETNLNKLESLVNNLVGNAIKFSPKYATVFFNAQIKNNTFYIEVKDQGSGISKDNQKNIFNKFYQEEKTGKSEGFGIGLAIVKDIVDTLKGTISVESETSEGAVFILEFPISGNTELSQINTITRQSKIEEKPKEEQRSNGFKQKNRLLIVEDNPYMVDYYEKVLSKEYQCDFVFNGVEGIDKLKNNKYHLVISDLMMPKMNGIEFRQEMRGVLKDNNTPFIMVTALDYEENKVEAFNIGVDDYVVKPFSKSELLARINCLIENKQRREEWNKLENEEESVVETYNEKKLKHIKGIILESIHKDDFTVTALAEYVNLSQRQLERTIKSLTGLTPVKFILEVKLIEAYKKIKNKEEEDVNNIRYSTGFKSASYFSVKFKERFGVNPSELLREELK